MFEPAQQMQCLPLAIVDDSTLEEEVEGLAVLLNSSDPDTTVGPSEVMIFIIDDDSK